MSDDLKARLREDQPVTQDMISTMKCALQDEAADRIEQLERERDEALNQLDSERYTVTIRENRIATLHSSTEALELALTQSRAETAAAYERAASMVKRLLEADDYYSPTDIVFQLQALATPDQTAALDKLIAEAVEPYAEALRVLISHTHECERELTEALYHADFCGESRPLTDARAILAASKKGGV